MIEEADSLFDLPAQLRRDIETHMANRRANKGAVTPKKMPTLDNGRPQSPVVNTIFSFVDRDAIQWTFFIGEDILAFCSHQSHQFLG